MKKNGKRNARDVQKKLKNNPPYEFVNSNKNNKENFQNNVQHFKYPKNKKKILNDKLLKQNQHDSIIVTSKESCGLIEKIMTQNIQENDENNIINENNNLNINDNPDRLLLSSIYELFEGYDEIIIKPNENNQYIIEATINLDENSQIKFRIIYDKERDYFDYYSLNKNFRFENDDEPFNYDLDIPKEDFPLLIKNFKKFKFENK